MTPDKWESLESSIKSTDNITFLINETDKAAMAHVRSIHENNKDNTTTKHAYNITGRNTFATPDPEEPADYNLDLYMDMLTIYHDRKRKGSNQSKRRRAGGPADVEPEPGNIQGKWKCSWPPGHPVYPG